MEESRINIIWDGFLLSRANLFLVENNEALAVEVVVASGLGITNMLSTIGGVDV